MYIKHHVVATDFMSESHEEIWGIRIREHQQAMKHKDIEKSALAVHNIMDCHEGIHWEVARIVSCPNGKFRKYLMEVIRIYYRETQALALNKREDSEKLLQT